MSPEGDGWAGAAVAGLVSLAGALLYLRRRLSSDNKEIARDKADTSLISRLERRAEEADARAQRAEARLMEQATELALAKADAAHLRADMARLLDEMRKRTRSLPDDIRRAVDTNFADFDDRPLPRDKKKP